MSLSLHGVSVVKEEDISALWQQSLTFSLWSSYEQLVVLILSAVTGGVLKIGWFLSLPSAVEGFTPLARGGLASTWDPSACVWRQWERSF